MFCCFLSKFFVACPDLLDRIVWADFLKHIPAICQNILRVKYADLELLLAFLGLSM